MLLFNRQTATLFGFRIKSKLITQYLCICDCPFSVDIFHVCGKEKSKRSTALQQLNDKCSTQQTKINDISSWSQMLFNINFLISLLSNKCFEKLSGNLCAGPGSGNVFTITGRMNYAISLAGGKNN